MGLAELLPEIQKLLIAPFLRSYIRSADPHISSYVLPAGHIM